MEWIIGGLVLAILYYFFIMRRAGNLPFWKTAAAYPMQAMMFFETNPHWHIGQKPSREDVLGPFWFADPRTGETLKLYCDSAHIEESQRDFMKDSMQDLKMLRSVVNSGSDFKKV